jgi:rsbT co-antagonist protein RsbR
MPMRERNQISGAVLTFQDISARQQTEAEQLAYLEERKHTQEQIIQLQQAQIANLSTPLIPIVDQVVLMPLIGTLDPQRGKQLLELLLHGIEAHRAQVAILDVTGLLVVDEAAANALIRSARAAGLLGTEVVLTGIRPEVAQTLVGMGSDLGGFVTASTLQEGMIYALNHQHVSA